MLGMGRAEASWYDDLMKVAYDMGGFGTMMVFAANYQALDDDEDHEGSEDSALSAACISCSAVTSGS